MKTAIKTPDEDDFEDLIKPIKKELDSHAKIIEACESIKDMLLEKNRKYGNSALEPVRIFSSADTKEQLNVRIDDKLNRIMQGHSDDNEDTLLDLIGYLILLKIHGP